ncbi:MAG: hypothetical protein FJ267_05310 [Planctomycetes bacterium]|nr:hypothetical protein [Verrucomicrobiota bacterium]MBM4075046.1 hypothetical protein [Planctomycetota bacterium]
MMHFATIITRSHRGYAEVLAGSLDQHAGAPCQLNCLVVDAEAVDPPCLIGRRSQIRFYGLQDLIEQSYMDVLCQKYKAENWDAFRWSLKPVFVSYLLGLDPECPVAFVDPDQFFTGDPHVLFEPLDHSRFLLSPHDRPIDPEAGGLFLDQFTDGMFNGGLFVATAEADEILAWWAKVCAYRCEKNRSAGLFVDQKYLDAVLTNFDRTSWIRHRGVNVASWNLSTRKRELSSHDGVLVDGQPLICVHFSGSTIRMIENGHDSCLTTTLAEYRQQLARCGQPTAPGKPEADGSKSEHSVCSGRWKSILRRFL